MFSCSRKKEARIESWMGSTSSNEKTNQKKRVSPGWPLEQALASSMMTKSVLFHIAMYLVGRVHRYRGQSLCDLCYDVFCACIVCKDDVCVLWPLPSDLSRQCQSTLCPQKTRPNAQFCIVVSVSTLRASPSSGDTEHLCPSTLCCHSSWKQSNPSCRCQSRHPQVPSSTSSLLNRTAERENCQHTMRHWTSVHAHSIMLHPALIFVSTTDENFHPIWYLRPQERSPDQKAPCRLPVWPHSIIALHDCTICVQSTQVFTIKDT